MYDKYLIEGKRGASSKILFSHSYDYNYSGMGEREMRSLHRREEKKNQSQLTDLIIRLNVNLFYLSVCVRIRLLVSIHLLFRHAPFFWRRNSRDCV